MQFDLARLPNNIAALHQIIVSQAADMASERDARAAREAELAAAKAGLVAKTLEIEKLKLQIARLQRAQFGRSSEKIAREIYQLELRLEELETETPSTPAVPDASARDDAEPTSPAVKAKRSARKPPPEHLPRREVAARAELHLPIVRRRDAQGGRGRDRDPRLCPRPFPK